MGLLQGGRSHCRVPRWTRQSHLLDSLLMSHLRSKYHSIRGNVNARSKSRQETVVWAASDDFKQESLEGEMKSYSFLCKHKTESSKRLLKNKD